MKTPCSDEEYYYKLDNMVLSSCQHLRNIFKNRWKAETREDWIDNKEHRLRFINGVGQTVYKKAQSFQKNALKTKSVEEWDMSLLSVVLQYFGDHEKYSTENSSVLKLKTLRNNLAHCGSKKLSQKKYDEYLEIFRDSLGSLGLKKRAIDKLIEKAEVTSSLKAVECVKALYKEGEECLANGRYDKAIEHFSEAIEMPNLLPVNLGTAYEKRAECLLKLVKDPLTDSENCDHALLDVEMALKLNDSSWTAHYLAAQCYRWKNQLSTAIHHYQRSLAISPIQKHVKSDLEACKVLAGVHSRQDHLNPHLMPMNLQERIADMEKETGLKMNEKQFVNLNKNVAGMVFKGQDHVFRGHQYFAGWSVPQDFTEAVKHYAKAASVKNPEGMYNLAMCYHYGRGVKQDVQMALRMYKEVAEMDRNTPGQATKLKFNTGVAGAQHAIGLMYDNGEGVEKDYVEAVFWYKRAMENGVGQAANNLGIIYYYGNGVPQDEKMAEFCWKQAVNLKDANAPSCLVTYYMDQMEPEKAVDMLRIGREMGNFGLLNIRDDEFNREIMSMKAMRALMETDILAFEEEHKLSAKGLTFKQRLNRQECYVDPNIAKLNEMFEKGTSLTSSEEKCKDDDDQFYPLLDKKTVSVLKERAKAGSEEALRVLKTMSSCSDMNALIAKNIKYSDTEKMEIINLLYNCTSLQFQFFYLPSPKATRKLKSLVAALFEEKCETIGEEDMKIRFCFVALNLSGTRHTDDMYGVELLKEGIKRYPENVNYYHWLTSFFGFKRNHQLGLFYAEEGLKLSPSDPDLLYDRASHMCHGELASPDILIGAYQKFLEVAAPDHKKIPEAHYQISGLYFHELRIRDDSLAKAHTFFQRGLDAERNQLPCYMPYVSEMKLILSTFLSPLFQTPLEVKPKSQDGTEVKVELPKSVLQRKEYLRSPTRKAIISLHRRILKETYEDMEMRKRDGLPPPKTTTATPKLKQGVPKKMSLVTPITLHQMNPTEDCVFENKIMDLIIIDDPNPFQYSIHVIAEDENGDTTRLYLYNMDKSKATMEKFCAGSRLAIINPYMRIGAQDITNGIRNDDPRCIVFLDKVENMCRFCGEENAAQKCSKCKRPYCSKECQELDWKQMSHKLICSVKY